MNRVQTPKEDFSVEGGIPFATNYDDIITFGGINPNPEINFTT
jgi:hypothetical protein